MDFDKILNRWISLVSVQDIDGVVSLYNENAVLLGTYSSEIRKGHKNIKLYFEKFLSKKPKAKIVKFTTDVLSKTSCVVNGFYDFEIEGGEIVCARFSFVFKKYKSSMQIISHHSSILP